MDDEDINDEYDEDYVEYEEEDDVWNPNQDSEDPNKVYNDDIYPQIIVENENEVENESEAEDVDLDVEEEVEPEIIPQDNVSKITEHIGANKTSIKISKFEYNRTLLILAGMIEEPSFNLPAIILNSIPERDSMSLAKYWIDNARRLPKIPIAICRYLPNNSLEIIYLEDVIGFEEAYSFSGGYPM